MRTLTRTAFVTILLLITISAFVSAQSTAKQTNVSIVQGMYNDFGKGNIPGVLGAMASDIEWSEAENFPYWTGKPFVGPDAVVQGVFAKIGSEWEFWNLTELRLQNMDNGMVLGTGRYHAKYKKTGVEIKAQFAHVWTLKDGKVIKFQQYTDTKQVAEAIK